MSLVERASEVLANTVARTLVAEGMVSGLDEVRLAAVVLRVLEQDLAMEQKINDEAQSLMRQHAGEISRHSMDTGVLYKKFRSEIARKRGFVL